MNDALLIAQYEAIFRSPDPMVIPLDSPIIERATELRVKYGFRTPDALHLATAIEQQATAFLTGDVQLSRCKELNVELL